MIDLNKYIEQGSRGTYFPPTSKQKGVALMSTYEEFMIILAFASLIVSILNLTIKNSRPGSAKVEDDYSLK